MPLRDIQPVQDIRMAGLVRRDERLEDDVIHQLPVARLMAQDRQGLIDPVQQQAGLPNAEQAVLQLRVPQRHLRVHYAEQRVQILQRLIQLLCDFTGEAFQGPDDVPVVLEHDLGVMVHIPAKLLLRKPGFRIGDVRISHDPPALQQGAQLLLGDRTILIRQFTTEGCLQICHFQYLHHPDPQARPVARFRGIIQNLASLEISLGSPP